MTDDYDEDIIDDEESEEEYLSAPVGTFEQLGRPQTPATKRKIAKAMEGKKNPAYKDGRRSYREKVKAPKGSLVHHKDGDSKNNTASNLQVIPKSQRSAHEKKHDRAKNFQSSGGRKEKPRGYQAKRLKK